MKKILEINKEPKLTSYIQHSYTNSIIDKSTISSFYVYGLNKNNWNIEENDILWKLENETSMVHLYERRGRRCTHFEMKRRCNLEDEVIVKIDSIKLMDAMTNMCLGINEKGSINSKQTAIFWFYWNQYDITTEKGHISYKDHFQLYYKMNRKGNDIKISVSSNMKKWNVIFETFCDLSNNKDLEIYIQFYFGENQYENWINMNYIQLFYNENDYNTVYLDYFMFPRKGSDASYQYLCHFLDTEYIDFGEYKKTNHEDILSYIKSSITQNYYVNVNLDEYYVENRGAYKSYKYEHYNLVYGFDDAKKIFYILGYNANGKIETSTLSYRLIKKALGGNYVVRYRYRVNECNYCFQLSYFIEVVKEYLGGENSNLRFAGMLTNTEGVYGIKIFEQLQNTERGNRLLLEDKRVSFILYEHCKLMLDRLSFLDNRGYIGIYCKRELYDKCKLMVKNAEILKNLVIKNSLQPKYKDNIFSYLSKLEAIEIDFLGCLLKQLEFLNKT